RAWCRSRSIYGNGTQISFPRACLSHGFPHAGCEAFYIVEGMLSELVGSSIAVHLLLPSGIICDSLSHSFSCKSIYDNNANGVAAEIGTSYQISHIVLLALQKSKSVHSASGLILTTHFVTLSLLSME